MASRALFVCIVGLLAVGLVDVVLPVSANIQQIGVIQVRQHVLTSHIIHVGACLALLVGSQQHIGLNYLSTLC